MAKLFRCLAGIGLGLLAACVLLETALRLLGYENVALDRTDGLLGYVGRAGLQGTQSNEGRSFVTLNAIGRHDIDHPRDKPPGQYRIVLLGDSFSAGLEADLGDIFARQLGPDLQSCPSLGGRPVDVVSLAYAGYGLAQQMILLREEVPAWRPDLVMLEIEPKYAVEDLLPNAGGLKTGPFLTFDGSDIAVDRSFAVKRGFRFKASEVYGAFLRLSDHSRLLQYLLELQFKLRQSPDNPEISDAGFDLPAWKTAFERTGLALRALQAEARQEHLPMVLALATRAVILDPTLKARRDDVVSDRIAALSSAIGLPILNITDDLAAEARSRHVYLHGFGGLVPGTGHWNRDGHAAAARAYAAGICRFLRAGTLAETKTP